MKQVYPESIPFAKRPTRNFSSELDALCRQKISEVVQAYLEFEVDDLLQRLRYERAGGELIGYRDGHDPQRTITTGAGPITIARPRVRGIKHESTLLPHHRRRLPSIDKTMQ
jgi:transposase-like protein